MTKLSGRQQLELSLMCEEARGMAPRGMLSPPALVPLVRYLHQEGITTTDFGQQLRRELAYAYEAARLLKSAPDGLPTNDIGAAVLSAAGVPFVTLPPL